MSCTEILFHDCTVEADAIFQMRVPPYTIRYLDGDRDQARADAMKYAREMLDAEYQRKIGNLLDCIRAEITFKDKNCEERERLIAGSWQPVYSKNKDRT